MTENFVHHCFLLLQKVTTNSDSTRNLSHLILVIAAVVIRLAAKHLLDPFLAIKFLSTV